MQLKLIRDDLIYGYLDVTLKQFYAKIQDNFYYKTFSNDNRCHETTKESQVQLKLIREHVTAVVKTFFLIHDTMHATP